MAVDWPATLPQNPASFSVRRKPIIVRTEPDSGPVKTRRRFTKAAKTANMSFLLTIEQALILDTFFENDLNSGTVAMNFRHPWTQQIVQMMVVEPPDASNDGNLGVNVSMKVEFF